jgi:archaellin
MGLSWPAATKRAGRGFAALDTAIVFIAAVGAGSIITFSLLAVSARSNDAGRAAAARALGEASGAMTLRGGVLTIRGDVDVDRDNVINLNGNDRRAVVKVSFVLAASDSRLPVDLTPPYTTNSSGMDPDASGLAYSTLLTFSSYDFQVRNAAWTVSFPGTDDGDYMLESGERAEVTLWLHPYDGANAHYDMGTDSSDPYVDASAGLLSANRPFTIEIVTSGSAALTIQRVTPLELGAADSLE